MSDRRISDRGIVGSDRHRDVNESRREILKERLELPTPDEARRLGVKTHPGALKLRDTLAQRMARFVTQDLEGGKGETRWNRAASKQNATSGER